jgi:quinol monooxygenase YgiN
LNYEPPKAGVYSPSQVNHLNLGSAVFEDVDAGPLFADALQVNHVRLKFRTFKCRHAKSRLAPRRKSMKLNLRKVVCQCILAAGVAAALVTSASAQNGNIQSVTFYTVKSDRVGDFQAEIKELNALYAKGGSTNYASMWVSLTGTREFVRASYYQKWAELDVMSDPKLKDEAADIARVAERIYACTESRRRIIAEIQPDLSLNTATEMPKMIRVLTTDVRPEKYKEYLALVKSDILPAAQKGGLKLYEFSETRYGGPNTQVSSVVNMDSWADLDGDFGVQKGLGKDGYQALMEKVRPLIVQSVVNEYRFLPEISYLPAPAAK